MCDGDVKRMLRSKSEVHVTSHVPSDDDVDADVDVDAWRRRSSVLHLPPAHGWEHNEVMSHPV